MNAASNSPSQLHLEHPLSSHESMLRTLRSKACSVSLTCRTITTSSNHNALSDVHKALTPRIRKPVRGGQNLSERYKRLEKSLRGKETFSRELDELVHPNAEPSSTSTKSQRKVSQLFHGFVIPEEPRAPADDECCMSGCTVCVYDLFEEALETYQEALSNLRTSLVKKNIPEDEWPQSVQTKSSLPNYGPEKRKDVILSAFEEMERTLELKKQKAEVETSSNSLKSIHLKKRHQVTESMKDAPRDTLLRELYQGLRWVLFSSR